MERMEIRGNQKVGQGTWCHEMMTGEGPTEKTILGFHYSDRPIKRFAEAETCFFVAGSRGRMKGEHAYLVVVPLGEYVRWFGHEFRLYLDHAGNIEIFQLSAKEADRIHEENL